ncbi:MAG: glycosyltransferase family 4 protein [Candidatus Woesearchaeota archaeon]
MISKLPRLIIATDNFMPKMDGISRFLETILPELKKHFKIIIICPDFKEKNIEIEGIEFVRIPLTKKYVGDFQLPKIKYNLISKTLKKDDVLFSQTIGPIGGLALWLSKKRNLKTIVYTHSLEWLLVSKSIHTFILKKISKIISKLWVKYLYRKVDYLIVPSERIADMLSWENINTPKKIINLGVDSNKFIPFSEDKRQKVRASMAINENEIVIGYHGRIAYEKDLNTLLRAFIKLRKKVNNIKLLIIGSGVPKLEKKFENQKDIIHIPMQMEVENYIPAIDIYCLPSLTETTSLSTLEAMSCGLPIVTTGVGFVRDYVRNNYNGYFFPLKDSYTLMKKLELLCKDKNLRQEFGKHSREIASSGFDWKDTQKKLIDFIIDLMINLVDKNE